MSEARKLWICMHTANGWRRDMCHVVVAEDGDVSLRTHALATQEEMKIDNLRPDQSEQSPDGTGGQ